MRSGYVSVRDLILEWDIVYDETWVNMLIAWENLYLLETPALLDAPRVPGGTQQASQLHASIMRLPTSIKQKKGLPRPSEDV